MTINFAIRNPQFESCSHFTTSYAFTLRASSARQIALITNSAAKKDRAGDPKILNKPAHPFEIRLKKKQHQLRNPGDRGKHDQKDRHLAQHVFRAGKRTAKI